MIENFPFPVQDLGHNRYRAEADALWEVAYQWARERGFKKEEGKYQGTPPT